MADARMEGLKARWERFSERERLMVGVLGAASFLVIIVVGVILGGSALGDLREENRAIRQALRDIDENRDSFMRARAKTQSLEARIGKGSVQLEGLLESAANQSDILISETNERQPMQIKNSKYVERGVDLRIRNCKLGQLANFLRKIETGPNLVVVSGLNVRVRDDKHQDLEVEMSVSTWERAAEKKGGTKGGAKGGGGAADKASKG